MTKLALCVGINNYPGTGADLSGCVNDAYDWDAFLTSRGYAVTTVVDADATRGNIVRALTTLVAGTGYQDSLVFTFSGHGTWVPDRNGDEADGRDEALVAADFGLILDDDLGAIYAQRRWGSRHVFVSDSCHSGTVSRLVAPTAQPQEPNGRKPRYLPPSVLMDSGTLQVAERVAAAPLRSFLTTSDVLLLSGCQDPEYSYDAWFGTRPNGAFTRSALDTIARLPAGATYRDLHAALPLPTSDFPQTPNISGSYRQVRWPAFA